MDLFELHRGSIDSSLGAGSSSQNDCRVCSCSQSHGFGCVAGLNDSFGPGHGCLHIFLYKTAKGTNFFSGGNPRASKGHMAYAKEHVFIHGGSGGDRHYCSCNPGLL